MAKYSFEFKKRIVDEYLAGEGGYSYLAKKYGVPSVRDVRKWVTNYKAFGDNGLLRSRKNDDYSFQQKLSIVELYLSSELSYQDIALQEGITTPGIITRWVNDFRITGPDALRPKKKGRKKSLEPLKDKKTITSENTIPVDASAKRIKQLEDELLKLRIENAYLKELRRLRLEEEALLKKRRESFTASEESSN